MKKAMQPITALKALVDLHESYSPSDWDDDWLKPWNNAINVVKNSVPAKEDEDLNNRLYYTPYEVGDLLDELYHDCAHGDEEHKKWLKNKMDAFFENRVKIKEKQPDSPPPEY